MRRKHAKPRSRPSPVDRAGKQRLDAAVRDRFSWSWSQTRERIRRGKIWIGGAPIVDIGYLLAHDEGFDFRPDAPVPRPETPTLPPDAIRTIDSDIIVVEKSAGLLTVPYRPTDRDTLEQRLRDLTASAKRKQRGATNPSVFVVHRLDKGTSGLLVFARSRHARNHLKDQFRAHTVHRRYVALVEGHVASTTVRSHLVRDRGDGQRGSVERAATRVRRRLGRGRIAITHIETIAQLAGVTLIACHLETGRTNQIRIHLAELGHPVVGDRVYRRDFEGDPTPTTRLCLHAAELGFLHPRTDEKQIFCSETPSAMQRVIERCGLRPG